MPPALAFAAPSQPKSPQELVARAFTHSCARHLSLSQTHSSPFPFLTLPYIRSFRNPWVTSLWRKWRLFSCEWIFPIYQMHLISFSENWVSPYFILMYYEKFSLYYSFKNVLGPLMVHTCKANYLVGWGRRIASSRPDWATSQDPVSK
jgi:hypothetical protein